MDVSKKKEGKWVKTDEGLRFAPKIYQSKGSMNLKERIESALNMIEDLEKGLIGEEPSKPYNPQLEAIREYLHKICQVLEQGIIE